MTAAAGDRPTQGWPAYLDAVEAGARAVERLALDPAADPATLAARLPVPPAPPGSPWPAALEPRRKEVLAVLAAATTTVERRRDAAAASLAALAGRTPPRRSGSYTDGAALDVLG